MTRLPDIRRYYARPVHTEWSELIALWLATNQERP